MKKTISFSIDKQIADDAERIYNVLGLDTEMALAMFLRRTVNEGRLPFGEVAPSVAPTSCASPVDAAQETPRQIQGRTNTAISQAMVDCVWSEFEILSKTGGVINSAASRVAEETGMNSGSAFIYLTILDNMVKGKYNTRNMKMKDLRFLVSNIKTKMGEPAYSNARKSLSLSIPYWDKPQFGNFAKRVQDFLDTTD